MLFLWKRKGLLDSGDTYMSVDNGFEIAPLNPGWIKRVVPDSYADDGLKKIIMFYEKRNY